MMNEGPALPTLTASSLRAPRLRSLPMVQPLAPPECAAPPPADTVEEETPLIVPTKKKKIEKLHPAPVEPFKEPPRPPPVAAATLPEEKKPSSGGGRKVNYNELLERIRSGHLAAPVDEPTEVLSPPPPPPSQGPTKKGKRHTARRLPPIASKSARPLPDSLPFDPARPSQTTPFTQENKPLTYNTVRRVRDRK